MTAALRVLGVEARYGDAGIEVRDPSFADRVLGGQGGLIAGRSQAVLSVDGVATFAVAGGDAVTVQADPSADPVAVEQLLHGPVAALLLAQRGRFALHASTVAVGDAGVAIAGAPGAGKTTAALALAARGHRLVADDLSPLRTDDPIRVEPSGRPLHVWPATAERMGLAVEGCPTTAERGKLIVALPATGPVELTRLVVLASDAAAEIVHAEDLAVGDAFALVTAHLWAARVVCAVWPAETFQAAASLVASVALTRLRRPAAGWTVEEVAAGIESLTADARSAVGSRP